MNLNKDSKILVIGLGKRTGLYASNFLAGMGCSVCVSDIKTEDELKSVISELDNRVTVIAGDQSPNILDRGFDLIVLSPGVPQNIPLVKAARERSIPVISEIELAYRYCKGRIIAITGTDGKSTTTSLVGHVLDGLGLSTFVGGNIGTPFISFAPQTRDGSVSVIELSSFQLETIEDFRPDVAAILNVTQDHMDRYEGMEDYFSAKLRISQNQNEEDFYVYNGEDQIITNGLDGIKANKQCFSISDKEADAFYEDGSIYVRINNEVNRALDTRRMQIIGVHNIENAMAALLMISSILEKMGIEPDLRKIAECCYSFKGLPHRMESVGDIKGRHFINDSKATTVGAVEMALKSLADKGVLIIGGKTKGDDYSKLSQSMKGKVRHLVLIGESAPEFQRLFKGFPYEIARSMDDAVVKAMSVSKEGDVIILSPACASFDMFANFEERGDTFKESFSKLNRGELSWTSNL